MVIFISYNSKDEASATWIAGVLEDAGHSTILQAWDFLPGENFVLKMDEAEKVSDKTLLVLSPHFFASNFTPAEWAEAFRRDPMSKERRIIPVEVAPCDVSGLLGPIVRVSIVGRLEEDARKVIISAVEGQSARSGPRPRYPK